MTEQHLQIKDKKYTYYQIPNEAERLPYSLKVLLENVIRYHSKGIIQENKTQAVLDWLKSGKSEEEIFYHPARVLMQDFTGVPAVVDLAAMRNAMASLGGDPKKINPQIPVDLVIDHSVQVDSYGKNYSFKANVDKEMERNYERYAFLRWGQQAFENFRVVPPGTGICHQVNLEYLAKAVWTQPGEANIVAYPDTCVGTDSHTTMINGLGVLGWGVGGIEAEAVMLGQAISMRIPDVIGFELKGRLSEGVTATDLVLMVTKMLREKGVVAKFVEFYGDGLADLPVADRATIANMAPEYGATCGFFPIDQLTVDYMRITGRDEETCELVEAYCKAQGLWRDENSQAPVFTDTLSLDIGTIVPSVAGPKLPQQHVALPDLPSVMSELSNELDDNSALGNGSVVIAAITSCTNTSNPSVMLAAGLVARNAINKGLKVKPWVKTSLAPGSKVVTRYLEKTDLQDDLDKLGFNLVGYGCTTCIGNSGPLDDAIAKEVDERKLVVASVLSGNRNFEGRVHPQVKASFLASPPLVVAYALAGTTNIDLSHQPVGQDNEGNDVYLRDIWPSNQEIAAKVHEVSKDMFTSEYGRIFEGDEDWQAISVPEGETYQWGTESTYVRQPDFFTGMSLDVNARHDIEKAKILAMLSDSITTDHISPAGAIRPDSAAGLYLQEQGCKPSEFNSYGSRRGNHEVMVRGTFGNTRLRNELVPGVEGSFARHPQSGETTSIYEAAMQHKKDGNSLVVFGGKSYGAGSSRDWAAKGTLLLGVKAVIAESFERIHRSNLIGMGVLPLQFATGESRKTWELEGAEVISVKGIQDGLTVGQSLQVTVERESGEQAQYTVTCRLDTPEEVEYFRHGGILQYVLRHLAVK